MKIKAGLAGLILLILIVAVPVVSAAEYTATNSLPPGIFDYATRTTSHFNKVMNMTYNDVANGKRISTIGFTIPVGSTVSFTIYYGANKTMTGTVEAHNVEWLPFPRTESTITFDGVSKSYDYLDWSPTYEYDFAGYAKETNQTGTDPVTGFMVYAYNYGDYDNDLAVFRPVSNIGANTIYQIDMSGTDQFDVTVETNTLAAVAGGASKSPVDLAWDFINFAVTMGSFVLGLVITVFTWAKFFLWDNLSMTIALYISMTMVFAARNSRGNMQKFFRQFFSDQRKLFEFFLSVWNGLISLISNFRGIFRI